MKNIFLLHIKHSQEARERLCCARMAEQDGLCDVNQMDVQPIKVLQVGVEEGKLGK